MVDWHTLEDSDLKGTFWGNKKWLILPAALVFIVVSPIVLIVMALWDFRDEIAEYFMECAIGIHYGVRIMCRPLVKLFWYIVGVVNGRKDQE